MLRARHVLVLLRRHVLLDQLALLPQHVRLRLLLLMQHRSILPDGLRLSLPRALEPRARTVHLLVGVVGLKRLAHVILLVPRLQRDDLVCPPPRLLNLLEGLPLLLA